jgi:DNA-binding NarL/FixJ family response regulator
MNILVADDSVQVRWALRTFVQEQLGWIVVGEATHSEGLLAKAAALRPDLILLEWDLPGRPAREVIDALHRQLGSCKIIVLDDSLECQGAALQAGADAFISKLGPPQQVLSVLCQFSVKSARGSCHSGASRIYQLQS